ncbi:hypothetical protein GMORB2_4471 [Geosmithia morbida]|uniref:Myb-like domain-containing protein n=1 Tax=Geosmithia morbida TaxID=1094350 RepID=A0A9P4YNG0_9HYPO|nr:uncharacterized protein GMORB2_4471 [Geosmithia morbida]KAF4119805.1 hypothetical protein GMORB2_4471 [Geosmithia morbida]
MSYPSQEALDLRRTGPTRHRKSLSTGGGRAWSQSEETYLVETRLQKMPYKHIAARLNKTELACRLHYHQISHGANRRRRNLSFSAVQFDHSSRAPSTDRLSPVSQRDEAPMPMAVSVSAVDPHSPPRLPSIMSASNSPQTNKTPAILPKPNPEASVPPSSYRAYSEGIHAQQQQQAQLKQHQRMVLPSMDAPMLKLDTALLPSASTPPSASHDSTHVDLMRLQAVYEAHRNTFWASIASEYGYNAAPSTLEQAWKSGRCCPPPQNMHHHSNTGPLTPFGSPIGDHGHGRSQSQERGSLSSILGPDVRSARDPWDRDMIRKMEVI